MRTIELIGRHEGRVATVTADNGTEFHSYPEIEAETGALFYFATPHHSWERGTNENTNGLLRQYLPKRKSMAQFTQVELRRDRGEAQHTTAETLGLQDPGGVLCISPVDESVRSASVAVSNLNSRAVTAITRLPPSE